MRPLVRRWDDFPKEQSRVGITRVGIGTANVKALIATLYRGMHVDPHSHEFDQSALIIAGCLFPFDEEVEEVGPRPIVCVSAGVRHYIEVLNEEPVIKVGLFSQPRADIASLRELVEE